VRVIELGSERWRRKRCPGCDSDLMIGDEDVSVERSWDGEDGCFDSRAYVVCVVCQRRFMVDVPSTLRERKLQETAVASPEKETPA